MGLRFTKLHGCGNDYVYLDGLRDALPQDLEALARRLADRHEGIGADGLIALLPSETADVRMHMRNADGSEAGMCGNGVRCVAKLARERGYAASDRVRVEVGFAGARRVLAIDVERDGERVTHATVAMGEPSFVRQEVPMVGPSGIEVVDEQIAVPKTRGLHTVTCLSLGNPHCVVFVEEAPSDALVHGEGPHLETHRVFPDRTNVGFAQVVDPERLRLRVWERGSGETRACGTGATAAVCAAIRSGRIPGPRAVVELPGGELEVTWERRTPSNPDVSNVAFLRGPAVAVFEGELLSDELL